MTPKPLVPRATALDDVDRALQHYLTTAGSDIALKFIDALERTYHQVAEAPTTGSPRWAHELNPTSG